MSVFIPEPLALNILRELDRAYYGLTQLRTEEELCYLWGLMQGLRRALKEAAKAHEEADAAADEKAEDGVPALVHWHYIDLVLDEKTGKTALKTKPETDGFLEVLVELANGKIDTDLFDAKHGRFDYFSFEEVTAWAYFPRGPEG